MFRKLVSNLPFSPALVGQLGFYARRLRQEQLTRRLGLFFTVLALIMQSLAVFSPPEQALASSGSDVIPGGVSSVGDILKNYDKGAAGQNDFKDFLDYFGVTRGEVAGMNKQGVTICSSDHSIISFGRQRHFSSADGTLVHHIPRAGGGTSTFYSVPLYRFDVINKTVNCYPAFVGNSKKIGWFAILKKCGNLEIKRTVQRIPKGNFISASCRTVQGFAYDERQTDQTVKVYLFLGGPPGKGKQYGPILANQKTPSSPAGAGHGFTFAVPAEYQKSSKATPVWGVLQPLAGWTETQVQFESNASIPGNCTPSASPIAECSLLKSQLIERTKFRLSASARAENGASIQGYQYVVTDQGGRVVFDKAYATNHPTSQSDIIELKDAGTYTARVIVKTSLGDKQGPHCTTPITVAAITQCAYNPALSPSDPNCKPCPYNPEIWVKDVDCVPSIAQSKEARNLTQNIPNAENAVAKPGDRIEYSIYVTNTGSAAAAAAVQENLSDVLQYATLVDTGGGDYDNATKTISWGEVQLATGQKISRRIMIQLLETIPSTPRGANDPAAFDCIISNTFGNTTNVKVACPTEKTIETTVQTLPRTGPTANVIFATLLLMIVTYFYFRSRQMNKEIRLIRSEYN